ncbi:MAG: hypothetical protein NTU49_00110 [Gammaproteobacteria bacterium]|nr:hypothetical protein [Gammaproteobacteria bacterium]
MLQKLGKTNIEITPIVMGCWQMGGAPYWQNINDETSHPLCQGQWYKIQVN